MATITTEEARTRVALQHPDFGADDVRREADRIVGTLEAIEAEDNLRAVINAQQADEQAQQAAVAAQRADAFNDAANIVRASHPDWGEDSVERAALHLAAENAAAVAALDLKAALADGFEPESYALRGRA